MRRTLSDERIEFGDTMKFYYDKNDLSKCYSLLPLPQFGENPAYIEVECKNLKQMMEEDMPQPDIIKADIEGVWYDFCTEILTYDVPFKAFLIEFELYRLTQTLYF